MATETAIQNPIKQIPGIKELPFLGSLPAYSKDRLAVFAKVARECGDVGVFHFGPFPLVMFNNSDILCPYTMHRRPDYFPNPGTFDPERFTPENEKRLPRYAYLPFGAGLRICIGNHFSLMEGHLLLATLAQRVTLDLIPGQHIVPDPNKTITIRPKHGLKMHIRRREV